MEDEEGQLSTYEIVGEDEADIHKAKVSCLSPLAETFIGAKLNDEVIWETPPPYTIPAKIPLTSGVGASKLTCNFLWVVLWVRGVVKTHILLIKFGKT
jgi:hypothetical protein